MSNTQARQVTYLQYESDDSEALRFNIYRALIDDGVCVIRGTPPEDNYLAEHFIPRLLECDVMSTQYGDSFYVRAVPDPINVAYAAYGLDMHQDMIYGESGPGLQLLHCLENSTLGGESLITDGMAVCEQLKEEEPEHFRVLSTTPILNEVAFTVLNCLFKGGGGRNHARSWVFSYRTVGTFQNFPIYLPLGTGSGISQRCPCPTHPPPPSSTTLGRRSMSLL